MGHRIEWQWRDAGSGPGHMQRVIVHDEVEEDAQTAFRDFLVHSVGCAGCKGPTGPCPLGVALGRAYRIARRKARQEAR